jgi:hypothetical protein
MAKPANKEDAAKSALDLALPLVKGERIRCEALQHTGPDYEREAQWCREAEEAIEWALTFWT